MQDERDRRWFDELVLPLLDSLYRYALWLTRNATEAEDLVQEAYVKALRGFEGFRPGTNIRAWMFRILRNTFLTSRSGLRAVPHTSIEDAPETLEETTPESLLLGTANLETLRGAIEELPFEFREVLLLSDVEEMSYKQIAETLSIPVGTVASRLIRARQKVRKALAHEQ